MFYFFVSCSSTPKRTQINVDGGDEGLQNIQQQVLSDISDMKKSSDYVLQAGDLVDIKVFMETDMDRTLRVSANGTVTFPLVGNVQIGGYSVSEAEDLLVEKLKTYIKNPQVSMLIKEYANKMVYVLGQIKTFGNTYSAGKNHYRVGSNNFRRRFYRYRQYV